MNQWPSINASLTGSARLIHAITKMFNLGFQMGQWWTQPGMCMVGNPTGHMRSMQANCTAVSLHLWTAQLQSAEGVEHATICGGWRSKTGQQHTKEKWEWHSEWKGSEERDSRTEHTSHSVSIWYMYTHTHTYSTHTQSCTCSLALTVRTKTGSPALHLRFLSFSVLSTSLCSLFSI